MYITLLERIKQEAANAVVQAATAATLQTRQVVGDSTKPSYNQSAIALTYGFIDYFDDKSFGGANWEKPTTVNPSKFGSSSQLATATPFLVTIGIAALMLRFFARTRFNAKFWWDDLFAVLAGMLVVADQLIFARIVYLGRASLNTMLQTTEEFEAERWRRITVGLKLYMVFELIYIFSSFFIKYSFLFLYLRISQETKSIKWFLRAGFLVTTISFIFCVLALLLTCAPLTDFWNIMNSKTSCERKILLTYGTGISNIVTDTMVLAILIPLLLQASLSKSQIRGVCILYACGALVIVASCLRFATQIMDVSMLQSMGWSLLEVSLSLILLCAPMGAKLLSAPLVQESGCPVTLKRNYNSDRRYSNSPFDKNLPAPPPIIAGVAVGEPEHVATLAAGQSREDIRFEGRRGTHGTIVRDVNSPMYKKIKVGTRESRNGQTIWEVQRRLSQSTIETSYSRNPSIATSRSQPLGGLSPPPPPPPPMDWPVRST
ncbi:hypothetical protein TWF788_011502 [Orbilia oligospora]|uniref:Rhodopsin domain-containing protein n=1 Tax=Orbilia oligospora TaxID=2813651 RepID=A0A7C8P5E9_ORBOL|nr:hypothetical protein TWF788_011502 [Orbilia oligospora]